MTEIAAAPELRLRAPNPWPLLWAVAITVALIMYVLSARWPWAVVYPEGAVIPFAAWIGQLMSFLQEKLTWFTRGLAWLLDKPLDAAFYVLARNFKIGSGADTIILPRLSWLGITAAVAIAGYAFGGARLATLGGVCMLYLAFFGQWDSAMLTLALILIAVPICVVSGVLVGIAAWRFPRLDALLITPTLDLMQTMPTFAYLIPMLLLFGNSPVSAMLATGIFATPPMVRATTLALSRVPAELNDFGDMVGCTRYQKLWRVLIPTGRPTLMLGVNQVIMLALNMVIIASMIGAGGLGYDVLLALRALKIGQGMEAGIAIVVLAIMLDRLSQAAAHRQARPWRPPGPFWQDHPYLTLALAVLAATTLLSLFVPELNKLPRHLTVTTAPMWKMAVDWVNRNYFDAIEAFRTTLLIYVLNPVRAFFEAIPWLAAVLLLALAGYQLSGVRLAVLVAGLTAFCAVTGLWEKTMATVYLCGVSALVAALLGMPLGLMAARNDRFSSFITIIIDTLQTIPSFCFIIPVVMLFRVGDVTAMIATVAFAIVPAIRYTNHGIRQVPPSLIEAAKVSGCTRSQTFWRVELPMAMPEIMLGINQTILLSLSMLITCAMIGTRDLGQEVFIALSKADAGRGIVAGFAICFIGIIADRLLGAWTAKSRARLGLT
jgi:glycine betaine/proline transport system permease protein